MDFRVWFFEYVIGFKYGFFLVWIISNMDFLKYGWLSMDF